MTREHICRRYYLQLVEADNGESKEETIKWLRNGIFPKIKEFKKEEYDLNIKLYDLTIFRVFKERSGYGDKENKCVFSVVLESDNWVSSDEENDFYDEEAFNTYLKDECNCFDAFKYNEEEISYDNI